MKYSANIIFIILVTFTIIGCSGIPVVKRSSCGPSGISMWKYRRYPYKSSEETEIYERKLQRKIDEYLANHPIRDDSLLFNFKELRVVVEGMNKEQVMLLYGSPDIMTSEAKQLKYNADEKWVYKSNSGENRIYFYNDLIIAMETKYYEPIVP